MDRRSKLWLAAASLSNLISGGAEGYALGMGEEAHAALHAVLLLLGPWRAWRVATRAPRHDAAPLAAGGRLEQLQDSVDAIAVEVERIGEAQRFTAKLK